MVSCKFMVVKRIIVIALANQQKIMYDLSQQHTWCGYITLVNTKKRTMIQRRKPLRPKKLHTENISTSNQDELKRLKSMLALSKESQIRPSSGKKPSGVLKSSSKPIAKKSKSDRAKAKDAAWSAFSLYIRTRDSIRTTGAIAECRCVTCGRKYPRLGKGCIQAGHFLAGRTGAVLFDEDGVNGQCYGCNVGRSGRHVEYTLYMLNKYGQVFIDQMLANSKKTLKYSVSDYEYIEKLYTGKTNELLKKYL